MSTLAVDLGMVRKLNSTAIFLAAALLFLVLAGCDTAEDRAQKHYESAMALLEEGDVDRAIIEFRNVFKLNNDHKQAREAYAKLQRERGFIGDSYGQYSRLVEQYPDDLEGRIALSEMALQTNNWEDLERHSSKAVELAPDNVKAKALNNALKYFFSIRDKDEDARKVAVDEAVTLVKQDAELPSARMVLIDDLVRQSKWEDALAQLAIAIEQNPEDERLYMMRVGILQQLGDMSELGVQLKMMNEKFPENEAIKQNLINYYMSQKDLDATEAFLREEAGKENDLNATRSLISFLIQFRGMDAAMEELKKVIAEAKLPIAPFQTALARMTFDQGQQEEAISSLETITKDAPRSDDTRSMEVELAKMYFQRGNSVEARRLIEKVLAEDSAQLDANKLKAAWLIEDDETGDAIVLLRDAMSQAPRDAGLMTLMAQAYEREGNRDLMREMLSLAVEASNNRAPEALRYARALVADEQELSAESVLINALRIEPNNVEILGTLGTLYLRLKNWAQAQGVIDRLNDLDTEQSKAIALNLTAKSLAGQNRSGELTAMLEDIAQNPNTKRAAETAIFRTRLAENGPQAALDYIEGLLADAPEDPDYLFLKAGALMTLEKSDEARVIYSDLVEKFPKSKQAWLTLYRVDRFLDDKDSARKVLSDAMAALPNEPDFEVIHAENLQLDGDFEGAIEIYSKLYEANSGSVVLANNLASLLADHREDADSLSKAFAIARRLKGVEVPAFQDTFGWIAYRMGNIEEALPSLEKAAAGMGNDSTVQFHYGMALASAGQKEKALEQLNIALEMAEAQTPPPAYLEELKAEIAKLKTP